LPPPAATQDKPVTVNRVTQAELDRALAPFFADAAASLPGALQRVRAGLPAGHTSYVTTRLRDTPDGPFEQLFVAVDELTAAGVAGTVASDVQALTTYESGDRVQVRLADVLDWTITAPDGREEGNVAGRFLDHYAPGGFFVVLFELEANARGEVTRVAVAGVRDPRRGPDHPIAMTPPSAFVNAATAALKATPYPTAKPGVAFFTYLI
jgi:hypothetical protein